jgi:endonuclease YncB( thermonuclease family)
MLNLARTALLSVAALTGAATVALPDEAHPAYQIPAMGVTLSTGDTWSYGGQQFRLYGVQACVRGTFFTNGAGQKRDCGEASLAYLAAVLKDTHPTCYGVGQLTRQDQPAQTTNIVVCAAKVGSSTLDLGTILITQGFAFAAYKADGMPAYVPYHVAERQAAERKAGLWAYAEVPHPVQVLLKAVRQQQ